MKIAKDQDGGLHCDNEFDGCAAKGLAETVAKRSWRGITFSFRSKPTAHLLQGTPAGWGVACLAGGDSETADNC